MQFTMQAELTEDEIVEAITDYVRAKVPMISETDELDIEFEHVYDNQSQTNSISATVSMTPPDAALAPKPKKGRPRKAAKVEEAPTKAPVEETQPEEPAAAEVPTEVESEPEAETPAAVDKPKPEEKPAAVTKPAKGAPLDFGAKKAANEAAADAEEAPKPKTKAGAIFNFGT